MWCLSTLAWAAFYRSWRMAVICWSALEAERTTTYRVASARLGMRQVDSEACCHGTPTMPRHIRRPVKPGHTDSANREFANRTCPGSQESSPCTNRSMVLRSETRFYFWTPVSHNSHILVTAFTLPSFLHNNDRLRSGESVISQSFIRLSFPFTLKSYSLCGAFLATCHAQL